MSAQDPFAASKRASKIRAIAIPSLIVIAAVIGFFLYTRSRQSIIIIQAPTTDLKVTLNGETTSGTVTDEGLRIQVIAGQYRLEVSRPAYLPFSEDVKIPVGETVAVRPVFTLIPVTEEQANQGGIQFVRTVPDTDLLYYLGDGGTRLYRVDTEQRTQVPVSERSLTPITDIQWPERADVALITKADGVYLFELPLYDFRTQRLEKVAGSEYLSPIWDPKDERIAAAMFLPSGERTLILTDKRFTTISRKVDLSGFTNPKLSWSPDGRYIVIVNRSQSSSQNNAWVYTLASNTLVSVTNSGDVTGASFSPTGRNLLLERTGGRLAVRGLTDATERPVGVTGSIAASSWRNDDSFYLPKPGTQRLFLATASGTLTEVNYTLPAPEPIQTLSFFTKTKALVLTTSKAVYTVTLGE